MKERETTKNVHFLLILRFEIQFCVSFSPLKMSHVILIDTIDHIRDLESYLKHCKDAINDIDEDLAMFNDMKECEIMVLVQQKSNYNKQSEQRKEKMVKQMEMINNKIIGLRETVENHSSNIDIENIVTNSESTVIDRPQGLGIDV